MKRDPISNNFSIPFPQFPFQNASHFLGHFLKRTSSSSQILICTALSCLSFSPIFRICTSMTQEVSSLNISSILFPMTINGFVYMHRNFAKTTLSLSLSLHTYTYFSTPNQIPNKISNTLTLIHQPVHLFFSFNLYLSFSTCSSHTSLSSLSQNLTHLSKYQYFLFTFLVFNCFYLISTT